MSHRHYTHTIVAALMAAALLNPGLGPRAQATEIYTWVDADGVTHFSQTPPETADTEVDVLRVDTRQFAVPSSGVDETMRIANQLEASRLARQRASREHELAREQLELEQQRLERQFAPAPTPIYNYAIPLRHRKKHHHGHRPPHKPRDCAPRCDDPSAPAVRGPRQVEHGTTHLKPYKSLR